jgi:hypothetical protein
MKPCFKDTVFFWLSHANKRQAESWDTFSLMMFLLLDVCQSEKDGDIESKRKALEQES